MFSCFESKVLLGLFCLSLAFLCLSCGSNTPTEEDDGTAPTGYVSPPAFTPLAGAFSTNQSITLSTGTTGATIYYTTNGKTPTTDSTRYSATVDVEGDGTKITIKAIAIKAGMLSSPVATGAFSINYTLTQITPKFDRPTSQFVDPINVSITADTAGATLHYTSDGTDPSCDSGTDYASPTTVAVNATTTVKAISCADDYLDSSVEEETYTLVVENTRVNPAGGTPIQDAVDAAADNDVIYVTPGSYPEAPVTINKPITVIGAGSGTDVNSNTIISYVGGGSANVILIPGNGILAGETVAVRSLRVTGADD